MISRSTVALLCSIPCLSLAAGTVFGQDFATQPDVAVFESISARVEKVVVGNAVDFVVVGAGYDNDFCTGARCQIERSGVPVAEIVLAEASRDRAVGLIIDLKNKQTILTGDTVKLQTI